LEALVGLGISFIFDKLFELDWILAHGGLPTQWQEAFARILRTTTDFTCHGLCIIDTCKKFKSALWSICKSTIIRNCYI